MWLRLQFDNVHHHKVWPWGGENPRRLCRTSALLSKSNHFVCFVSRPCPLFLCSKDCTKDWYTLTCWNSTSFYKVENSIWFVNKMGCDFTLLMSFMSFCIRKKWSEVWNEVWMSVKTCAMATTPTWSFQFEVYLWPKFKHQFRALTYSKQSMRAVDESRNLSVSVKLWENFAMTQKRFTSRTEIS